MIGRDICPRHAFLLDLIEEINSGLETGDHILLMMDGNSNMKKSDTDTALREFPFKKSYYNAMVSWAQLLINGILVMCQ